MRSRHSAKPARKSAEWVRDAVLYEVYLRSFSPEGTFRSLENRLDDLKQLGATVLWLMPIHPVGAEKRKGTLGSPYAVKDFRAVNPEFGTMDDFKSLVEAVHRRDMKIIIDLVANHTAWDCDLLRDHPEWYHRDDKGEIRPPIPDWSDVAHLNYDQPALREYMTDVMLFWVRDIGIDGFRCDVAGMVPLDFWEHARRKLDAIKPVMMLAEDDKPDQHLAAFDLTYDWDTYSILGDLPKSTLQPMNVADVLSEQDYDFPNDSLRMRFSTNHDMCAWHEPGFVRYGRQAAPAAAALTFTLPGVPLIYNGQEAANSTKLDLFEKVPINWSADDHGMRRVFSDLARVRRDRRSLQRGAFRILPELTEDHILAFARTFGKERTLVLINLSQQEATVDLTKLSAQPPKTLLRHGPPRTPPADGSLHLGPFGFWIGADK